MNRLDNISSWSVRRPEVFYTSYGVSIIENLHETGQVISLYSYGSTYEIYQQLLKLGLIDSNLDPLTLSIDHDENIIYLTDTKTDVYRPIFCLIRLLENNVRVKAN